MANKEELIIPLAVAKDAPTIEATCITCQNGMTLYRCSRFPICDDCLKDLREIISERRKPKVVELDRRPIND